MIVEDGENEGQAGQARWGLGSGRSVSCSFYLPEGCDHAYKHDHRALICSVDLGDVSLQARQREVEREGEAEH